MTQMMKNVSDTVRTAKENYYKPTPKKLRIIGDSIQDGAIAIGALVTLIAAPPAWVPIAILVIGRIGKILTNFGTK